MEQHGALPVYICLVDVVNYAPPQWRRGPGSPRRGQVASRGTAENSGRVSFKVDKWLSRKMKRDRRVSKSRHP